MVDGCFKENRRRRVRIVVREGEGELEGQSLVWCLVGSADRGRPVEKVAVCVGKGRDAGRGGHHQLHQLCLETIRCRTAR